MDSLFRFLNQYEVLFYILIGSVILVYARKVYLAWREWSVSLFGLEKENSQRKINQGITIMIFSGLLGVGLFLITTFVIPSVPGVQQLPTQSIIPTEVATLPFETPVLEVTQQGLIPTLTAFLGQGCVPGQIEWTDPVDGGDITGQVVLKGTINVLNLGFYKYEFAPVDSEAWKTIAAGSQAVIDGPLGGTWDTKDLVPGEYQLRLVVTNNQDVAMPDCTIKVTIKASK
jgi:hypothetical protein